MRELTRVTSLDRYAGRWRIRTDDGELRSRAVVLATGPFQRSRLPRLSDALPQDLLQLHSVDHRDPDQLPEGAVLVVGSGASGAQIAEELAVAGRATYLCVSRHRRVPRRFLDRDVFTWLVQIVAMDRTRADWVDRLMPPTVLVTGIGGGHDVNLRDLERRGVTLLGTLRGVASDVLQLADDARSILEAADTMCDETVLAIAQHARSQGFDVPDLEPSGPPDHRTYPETLSLRDADVTNVVWATGYAFDYGWVHVPCLGAISEPVQRRGVADGDGLYFLGLHWMHTFKSGTFLGIGDDTAHVVDHLVAHAPRSGWSSGHGPRVRTRNRWY